MQCNFLEGQVVQNMESDKISKWEWCDWENLPENVLLSIKNLKDQNAYTT